MKDTINIYLIKLYEAKLELPSGFKGHKTDFPLVDENSNDGFKPGLTIDTKLGDSDTLMSDVAKVNFFKNKV